MCCVSSLFSPRELWASFVFCQVAFMKGRGRGSAESQSPYSPHFLKALDDFEERVCVAQGLAMLGAKLSVGGRGDRGEPGSTAGGWLINR